MKSRLITITLTVLVLVLVVINFLSPYPWNKNDLLILYQAGNNMSNLSEENQYDNERIVRYMKHQIDNYGISAGDSDVFQKAFRIREATASFIGAFDDLELMVVEAAGGYDENGMPLSLASTSNITGDQIDHLSVLVSAFSDTLINVTGHDSFKESMSVEFQKLILEINGSLPISASLFQLNGFKQRVIKLEHKVLTRFKKELSGEISEIFGDY